jgi:glucokinase
MADDVVALLDHLAIDRATVGGVSMGSAVALNLALRHPDRVSALILSRPAWLAGRQPAEKIALYDTIARLLRSHGPDAGRAIFADSPELKAIESASPDSAASLLSQFSRQQATESIDVLERIPRDAPTRDRSAWAAITVPTLVLANQQDPIHPFSYGETLAAEIPTATFAELTAKTVSRTDHVRDYQRHLSGFLRRPSTGPRSVRRNGTTGAVLAVDLGGTQIRAALADDQGRLLCREVLPTPAQDGAEAVVDAIMALLKRQATPGVRHIGISAAGPVDTRTGVVIAAPTIRGFNQIPLKRLAEDALGIPTSVVNDTNAAALAEWALGSGHRARHFAYVTISTGIGCGLVIDGQVLDGRRGAAGELGHCIVEPDGPECTCGGRGHLEGLASGTAIAHQARDAVARGETTAIGEFARHGVITAETVYRAAAHGDRLARALFEDAAHRVGCALANLVALFDPDVIAIGGGVSLAGDLLWTPLRATLDRELAALAATDIEVVPALLGDDAGLHGAAMIALHTGADTTHTTRATAAGRFADNRAHI